MEHLIRYETEEYTTHNPTSWLAFAKVRGWLEIRPYILGKILSNHRKQSQDTEFGLQNLYLKNTGSPKRRDLTGETFNTYNMPTAYNHKSTALATGVHVAAREQEASTGTAVVSTVATDVPAAGSLAFAFTTLASNPNNADWPNGTYRCVMDVTTATHADITYGLLTLEGFAGHFSRVNSGLTADSETTIQAEAAFSGSGIKTATVSWDPAAGLAGDRYEGLIAAGNANAKNQEFELEVNDGGGFLEFPDAGSGVVGPGHEYTIITS